MKVVENAFDAGDIMLFKSYSHLFSFPPLSVESGKCRGTENDDRAA